MNKLIALTLFTLLFTGSAIAKQIVIEIENKTAKSFYTPYGMAVVQYPQLGQPHYPIKEIVLDWGQKDKFYYNLDSRNSTDEMNIDIRHITDGSRLCNIIVYTNGDIQVENIWYPEYPNLNGYVCESNITKELGEDVYGWHVVIKDRNPK